MDIPGLEAPAVRTPVRAAAAWGALAAIGLAWGSSQLMSKVIVNAGHPPIAIAFTSTVLGAVILLGYLAARGKRLPLGRRDIVFYFVCGLLGTALPNSASYYGYQELSVGVIAIVLATVPMATLLGALALGMERAEPLRMTGIGLGTLAVVLLVVPEASLPRPGQALWVVLPVITSLSYAAENLYIAKVKRADLEPLVMLTGLFCGASVLLFPANVAIGEWMAPWPLDIARVALIGQTLAHICAYGGFVWLIGRAGPVFAAQVSYVVTLTGVFLGMAVLDETHSHWVWLSLAAMLIGLALVKPR